MATFKAYANGATMGRGNNAPTGGNEARSTAGQGGLCVAICSASTAVEVPISSTAIGFGVTLTIRNTPPTPHQWMDTGTASAQRVPYCWADPVALGGGVAETRHAASASGGLCPCRLDSARFADN